MLKKVMPISKPGVAEAAYSGDPAGVLFCVEGDV